MFNFLLIIAGTITLGIGIIGIFVPGLPTTVFLLITAACYVRSSPKLYNWLINHKVYGKFIKDYQEKKGMQLKHKLSALLMMWISITASTVFFIENNVVIIIVLLCGLIGTIVILNVRTLKEE